jgi:hypothetical protein
MERDDDHDRMQTTGRANAAGSPKSLLPSDLAGSLTHLSEQDIKRLAEALDTEMRRRGISVPPIDTKRPQRSRTRAADLPELTRSQISLIRSSIKAGVKPSVLSRQFGLSQSQIRAALEEKK